MIRKRVGGGFVYVPAKPVDKNRADEEQKEKQEATADAGNTITDIIGLSSGHTSPSSLSHDGLRYDDHPILRYVQDNVIGHNLAVDGPFGTKRVVYCDYTASGRSLAFIEDYIRTYVCPFYANTHSETGRNARQTSKYREDARDIVKQCVNAGKDDVVIFTGSGATSGMHKLAWGLKVNHTRVAEETCVLTCPYEHHSNILLWKEFGATVVRIKETHDGSVDIDHLDTELKFWKEKKRHLLVSMSAASNVTGITTDTEAVATTAHKHGALAIFDYAGGGPYLNIDMCPSKKGYKDAVIVSPHKFVGGPGTPGLLVAKKWMFKNHVPDRVGGGTVVYVSRDLHTYSSNIEAREEGGTPAIIESIRTGMVFQLKQAIGHELIHTREHEVCRRVFSVWNENPCLCILGSDSVDRDLLGITETMAKRLKWFVSENPGMDASIPASPMSIMRPGFVRVNFPYFYDDETVDYVIKAVDAVARYGWKLLPQYTFDPYSGSFTWKGETKPEEAHYSLRDLDYANKGMLHINRKPPKIGDHITLKRMLKEGMAILNDSGAIAKDTKCPESRDLCLLIPKDKRKLRWFLTPQEALDILNGRKRRFYRNIFLPRGFQPSLPDTSTDLDTPLSTDRSEDPRVARTYRDQLSRRRRDTEVLGARAMKPGRSLQNLHTLHYNNDDVFHTDTTRKSNKGATNRLSRGDEDDVKLDIQNAQKNRSIQDVEPKGNTPEDHWLPGGQGPQCSRGIKEH